MWVEFWFATLAGALFLFVPAFVILKALRFSQIVSAAAAPLVSLLFYSLLAVLYGEVGVFTTGWTLFFPLCIAAVAAVIIRALVNRSASQRGSHASVAKFDVHKIWTQESWLILLYVGIGIAVGAYVFLGSLATSDCTSYNYDDQSHLGYLMSFLERGNYSSLSVNYEYDLGGAGGYYPAAWHLLAASVVSMCGIPNFVGANVALFLICAVVYPLCCLALVRKIFSHDIGIQVVGAFFTLAFAAFPWEFVFYGRLVANLLAFAFVPLMLLCTIEMFSINGRTAVRVRFAVLLFASFVLSLFTQPSVCFTWLFFSVPYLMHVLWTAKAKDGSEASMRRKVIRVAIFLLVVFFFLIFCYMLPALNGLTRFKWPAPLSIPEAIGKVVFQGSSSGPGSFVLAAVVIVGIVVALRKKEQRWLVLLFVMLAVMYVVDASTNLRLKNYLTGWWYTDSHRVLAMFAIASYYLAVFGAGSMARWLASRLGSKGARRACYVGCAALLAVVALLPSFEVGSSQVTTSIGQARTSIRGIYRISAQDDVLMISAPEREFIKKAAEITGDDLVFNIPKDGSAFAYQISGMKTFYRWVFEGLSPNANPRLIQRSLDDITTNQSVRRAVDDLGIKYVMMLDQGHEPYHAFWGDYSDSNWKGVLDINEDTPGFELVLSDGDMKLYRILSEGEVADSPEDI